MKSFDEYVALAEQVHGHICAGQILGLPLALYGLHLLQIADPDGQDGQRLIAFVEIDRCATDAVVTGCRMGRRALKFRDFGKVAATFCDLREGCAVRVAARESSQQRAGEMYPGIPDQKSQQMRAYREMPDRELFDAQWVRVRIGPEDLPGYKGPRAVCGESVHFGREAPRDGAALCRSCAGERYYEPIEP